VLHSDIDGGAEVLNPEGLFVNSNIIQCQYEKHAQSDVKSVSSKMECRKRVLDKCPDGNDSRWISAKDTEGSTCFPVPNP
jgi:hypothetical protein